MKGNNQMSINQATMIEAVQLWCDSTFKTKVRVEKVTREGTRMPEEFVIHLTEPEQNGEPPDH